MRKLTKPRYLKLSTRLYHWGWRKTDTILAQFNHALSELDKMKVNNATFCLVNLPNLNRPELLNFHGYVGFLNIAHRLFRERQMIPEFHLCIQIIANYTLVLKIYLFKGWIWMNRTFQKCLVKTTNMFPTAVMEWLVHSYLQQ